jgi:hypothetical protein
MAVMRLEIKRTTLNSPPFAGSYLTRNVWGVFVLTNRIATKIWRTLVTGSSQDIFYLPAFSVNGAFGIQARPASNTGLRQAKGAALRRAWI